MGAKELSAHRHLPSSPSSVGHPPTASPAAQGEDLLETHLNLQLPPRSAKVNSGECAATFRG